MFYKKNINLIHLAALLLIAVVAASCSDSDSTLSEEEADVVNWQARNDSFFENIYNQAYDSIQAGNKNWYIFKSYTKGTPATEGTATKKTDNIVVYVVSQDAQHKGHDENTFTTWPSPLANDTANVHYRGRLMPSDKYPEGKQFDTSWYGEYNTERMSTSAFAPTGVVDGFGTALQHMHCGDRWMVFIPYTLGYNATGNGTTGTSSWIPAYSTLIFDITLVSFKRPQQTR